MELNLMMNNHRRTKSFLSPPTQEHLTISKLQEHFQYYLTEIRAVPRPSLFVG
jgi:hypothetical protein